MERKPNQYGRFSLGGQEITRSYHSPVRAQHAESTRRRIVEVARTLFAEHGYAATPISRIANEAGVSSQTIYNSIGPKPALLVALNDLVDEVGGVASAQQRIGESEDAVEILALAVRLRRLMMEQAGDIVDTLAAAATFDADVAQAYAQGQQRSRAGIRWLAERLAALDALRDDLDLDQVADALYAVLHHAVWTRLVDECGWSPEAFESWCADLLQRMVLADAWRRDPR